MFGIVHKILHPHEAPLTEEEVAQCWAEVYAKAVEHPGRIVRKHLPNHGEIACVVPPFNPQHGHPQWHQH